jgi:ribonuclease G
MKSKGARLTTEISLPGRYLVYVPNGEGSGVSRRLDEEERARLKEILAGLDAKGGGIIVRTAAEGASAEDIERDLVFLQRLWRTIQAKAKTVSAPALVYQEAELPLRIVRDLFTGDFVAARIDDDRTFRRIVGYLKKTSPHMVERVHRYREKEPLFQVYGVDREIASTLERRVDLPSGGYLVFDYAEAFTVIDVNTGRFVGSRAKGATGRLEDTIVKNNLEAVREVVRQLRLRDIGGIIVIDFIDMANPKNRQTVEEALRTELERDRTKTYVVEISPLGLVEMTRQNVTEGPREILTAKCAACGGDGFVVSDATHALTVERKLKALAKGSRVQAFQVAVHPRVLPILAGPAGARLEAIERSTRRRFFLVPARDANVPLDTVEVLAQGKVDALRPEAPVEEGATIELRLVEVGLHDKAAAVGKLDGTEVVVAGAAKLVGRKVEVRVGRVLDGIAFASLVEEAERPAPVTFEAEAEKPTRAPARRRPEVEAVAAEPEETVPETEVDETTVPLETAPAGEGGVLAAEAAPKRKRTRRGSRGGRARRKSPETTEQVALAEERPEVSARPTEAAEELAQPENGRLRAPRIHLPPPDVGQEPALTLASAEGVSIEATGDDETGAEVLEGALDGQPKRKRTRRGTRGGRRRRKAPAASDGVTAEVAEDPGIAGEPGVASVARAAIETAAEHAG